jgi:diphthine-ammonia ligase
VLFSGGKDSTFALWCAIHQAHDVACLLTIIPERRDSWMFHHPAVEWTGLQAKALGFPVVTAKTSGVKEEELTALRQSLSELVSSLGIECVVTGAIASEYQRSRIDRICDELGIQAMAPLWGKSPKRLLREEIEMGFEFVLTACMAMGLDQSWLGRVIDTDALKELENISQRHGINLAFEGGEAETFVTDAPIFSKRIRIVEAEPIWKGDSGYLRIVRAEFDEESRKSV